MPVVVQVLPVESLNLWDGPVAAIMVIAVQALPIGLGLVATTRARRARKRADAAATSWVASAPLEPGPSVVVHGPVEYAPGEPCALRVEIVQKGTEQQSKGKYSHTWMEKRRDVTARPFYVADERGTRVRVQPDERTLLLDSLGEGVITGPAERTRVAELSAGEKVFVIGALAGESGDTPYRSGASDLVLTAPSREPLVVAAEPLEARFRRTQDDERANRKALFIAAAIVALLQGGYYARGVLGQHELGQVTEARHVQSKRNNAKCNLEVVTASGSRFTDSSRPSDCARLHPGGEFMSGVRVPIVDPGLGGWFAQVGTKPGIHFATVIMALIVSIGAALIYSFRQRPWYEGPVNDMGSGRLPR